jgi:hypothetical protein
LLILLLNLQRKTPAMQKIFTIVFIVFTLTANAQTIYYAAAKTGISLRELPNSNAKLVDKIPYGEKLVTVSVDSFPPSVIVTEGFKGYWWKVEYNNKQGYVSSSYLLPVPPPKTGIKTLKDYFAQVSPTLGDKLVIKKSDPALNEMGESSLTKQFFTNGMEWHETQGYEYGAEVYMLPGFSVEQSFFLLRIINQYPDLIGEKDAFPVKKISTKNAEGEKIIDIEREDSDSRSPVKKIKITSTKGVVTEFEIFILDEQAVIFYRSGV